MSKITEKLDSLIENFVGDQSTNEEFERAQEFANQVFKLAMQAEKKAISVMKSKIAKYESDDYVLVPKGPTVEMIVSGLDTIKEVDSNKGRYSGSVTEIYIAMIEAQE